MHTWHITDTQKMLAGIIKLVHMKLKHKISEKKNTYIAEQMEIIATDQEMW